MLQDSFGIQPGRRILTLHDRRHRLPQRRIYRGVSIGGIYLNSRPADRLQYEPGYGFASRAVHAGERAPRPDFTPTSTPIYPATAFIYDDTATLDAVFGNERPGYVYTRHGNPTTSALEAAIASLEGTDDAVAFSSGMAAVNAAILLGARAGDQVLAAADLYGASYAVLDTLLPTLGISATFVDMADLGGLVAAARDLRPSLMYLETISNPLMRVADIPAIARIAQGIGSMLVVDNTFASPWLVNPARLGADLVVHSTTKYLGGHGDVTGGAVAASRASSDKLRNLVKLLGASPGPFDSWLALRGLKTLPLRMKQQSDNAAIVARTLAQDHRVERVHYPGLSELGAADDVFTRKERGGMLSFEIRDAGAPQVFAFLEALTMIVPATTLGDVSSLVLYPAISSHRTVPVEDRARLGISDSLVRVSVGIEDVEDILADLDQALAAAMRT